MSETKTVIWESVVDQLIENLKTSPIQRAKKPETVLKNIRDFLLANRTIKALDSVCKMLKVVGADEEFVNTAFKEAYDFFNLTDNLGLLDLCVIPTENGDSSEEIS